MSTQDDIEIMRYALGKRIIMLRTNRGMTQEELCAKIDMDRTYLARVETGQKNVSFDNLVRLAYGLDTTLSTLCLNVDIHVLKRMHGENDYA